MLDAQIPRIREAYRLRRDAMLEALAGFFPAGIRWTRPEGGMFLLATLPDGVQSSVLLKQALQQKVAFVPGDDFYVDSTGRNTLRLNFTNSSPAKIREGIRRLGLLLTRLSLLEGGSVRKWLKNRRRTKKVCTKLTRVAPRLSA